MRAPVLLLVCILHAALLLGCADDSVGQGDTAISGDILADAAGDAAGDAVGPAADAQDGGDVTTDGTDDFGRRTPDTPEQPPAQVCPPDVTGCFEGSLLVCNKAGLAFEIVPCDEGLVCADGECVECASELDCDPHFQCVEGECFLPPLEILTPALEPVLEGVASSQQLEAAGGAPPYIWRIDGGELPPGTTLSEDGELAGLSTLVGQWPVFITAEDSLGQTVTEPFTLEVLEHGLVITTVSPLPLGTSGEPYELQLQALGGEPPYFWGISQGELPVGLSLSSGGVISGTPEDSAQLTFTVKVFDNSAPPLVATKSFTLPIVIAPLEIIGETEIDIVVTKLIVLPLIVSVAGIEIPYNAQLEAKGGKKPLHWSEDAFPDLVGGLIPNAGLPAGLTINDDGSITGGVSDPSLAVSIDIPFVNISLSGFFFAARVDDDQAVPFHDSALYIIPTLPIGN